MPAKIQIQQGKVFGRLTILKEISAEKGSRVFECLCSCGNTCNKTIKALIKNSISSCGCYQREFNNSPRVNMRSENHHFLNTRLYRIWAGMKKRCYNQNCRAFKWYGAKGISVCEEWTNSFLCFRDWALKNGYNDQLTIDRIDSDKNYSEDNCRWVDMRTQNANKKNNRIVFFQGKNMCVSEVSRISNTPYTTIISRLNKGLSLKKAVYGF